RVELPRVVAQRRGLPRRQRRPGAVGDGGARGHPLQATGMPLPAGGAVAVDDHVADLPGGAGEARVELAVEDQAAAHPGADGDEDEVAGATAGAGGPLRVAGEVGVVLDDDVAAVEA